MTTATEPMLDASRDFIGGDPDGTTTALASADGASGATLRAVLARADGDEPAPEDEATWIVDQFLGGCAAPMTKA